MLMVSPVLGLRPAEGLRRVTEKVPKPTRRTSSPPWSAFMMFSIVASMTCVASRLVSWVSFATLLISSILFIAGPFDVGRSGDATQLGNPLAEIQGFFG